MQAKQRVLMWRLVIITAILLVICIALLAISLHSFHLRDHGAIEERLSRLLGFAVSIDGPIEVRLSLRPRLHLQDVRLRQPGAGTKSDAFAAKTVNAQVDLLPMLSNKWSIRRLEVEDAEVCVSTRHDSPCDWRLALRAIDGVTNVDKITIRRLEVTCHGGPCGNAMKQSISLLTASLPAHGQTKIEIYREHDDAPFAVVEGDSWNAFRANRPWDVKASVRLARMRMEAEGTIDKPRELRGVDLQVDGRVGLDKWHGVALDDLHVRGHLTEDKDGYRFHIDKGEWGSGKLSGDVQAEKTDAGLRIRGTGAARDLDLERWLDTPTQDQAMAGYINADTTFETTGATVDEWLEHIRGAARVEAGPAEFPIEQVERWSKGFLKFAFSLPSEGSITHIRCMGGNFELRDGRAVTKNLRIDTETTRMRGLGSLALPSGEMDFLVKPTLKRGPLRNAPLVQVSGKIERPVTRLATEESKTEFKPVLESLPDRPADRSQPCA
ncbi:MAG TPA: AsmA-like C-terminal region-containing protein [Steroidobacteraceae bacterium]|nr:AsmA-like C-terminal region-containing protein [Steroidobacteraceae bacterium]